MTALLTKSEVAKILGVSPSVVTRLVNSGSLDFSEAGKRQLIHGESVLSYLRANNITQAPLDQSRKTEDIPALIGLSFFSGAGGLDLGLERAGVTNVFYCENNRAARMTLYANHPEAALAGDVNDLDGTTVRRLARIGNHDIDVMAGGPPCQAFSTAGARKAFDDPRGNIFLKYIDLAEELKPKYLVIENVRGLLSTPFPLSPGTAPVKGGALHLILKRLRAIGYSVSFNLYNAANYGAAQIRERVVIIAKRDGSPMPWLRPTHSDDPKWNLPKWRTFGDVASELDDSLEHHNSQFPEKRLRYFRLLKEGQHWKHLPPELQKEALGKAFELGGGKTGFYRRISFDRPSPTLVTSPTMPATDLCHPTELRPLSVEEYKAIQGFPDDWWIAGAVTDQYRQIGNAVPVELGEAIGRAIINDMNGKTDDMTDFVNFPFSRYRLTSDLTWVDPAS
ncbi:DNA cytosine methyltransferase [Corynebacterium flavescens]|uniref:DNA cytosine methyltransferase n=1 Tax=Corynebacterium flavescens TaxID=28028 RepID=UPI002649E7B7|nr:DNA cytosine methyltransferase [Corynebacterium flavescens]MDN6822936.1 DNA cytosine methyltransferase [Corynebacterium flavescens]